LSVDVLVLPCREISKTAEMAHRICQACAEAGIDRKGVIVALGGGVCSDLCTFAASMFKRGIDTIRIPTTLIGQIDAAIGLKGGANFHGAKNAIGCFHAPRTVLVDPVFLNTLQAQHLSQGLAEILKIALIRDAELFDVLERSAPRLLRSRFQDPPDVARFVIRRAILGMLEELEANPFETKTYQRLVDMGHTISPILEAESGFELHHGFAVAIDMAFTAALSVVLGTMAEDEAQRFLRVTAECDLPLSDPLLTRDRVLHSFRAAVAHRGGSLNLPLPLAIGACTFVEDLEAVPRQAIDEAFDWLHSHVQPEIVCVAAQ
jgi:3-dehydroquinate synthase